MIIDPVKVSALIAEIAEEEIAPRFGKLAAADIDTKTGPSDFVTKADRAAEQALEKALKDIRPDAVFIGEEHISDDPDSIAELSGKGAFWIVDPLDGTRNFVQGREEFGSIVAFVEDGEIRIGWIYAIPDRACAIAELGSGAAWRGEVLSPVTEKQDALVGYRGVGALHPDWRDRLVPLLRDKFETEPARCAAYAYINLARGIRDFSLFSRANPWDHAAGALVLHEIGGRVAYLDDKSPYTPTPTVGRPLLSAGSVLHWNRVEQTLITDARA